MYTDVMDKILGGSPATKLLLVMDSSTDAEAIIDNDEE